MARIRTIKPEFWTHPITGRLTDATKWIAVALLNHADDEGYFRADPAVVRGAIAPFVEASTSIRRALDECSRVGWIELREHPTQGWIGRIVNFAKHQRIDRPSASRIKDYWQFDEPSTSPRRILDEPSLPEGNREGKGREQGAREGGPPSADVLALDMQARGALPKGADTRLVSAWREYQMSQGTDGFGAFCRQVRAAEAAGATLAGLLEWCRENPGRHVHEARDALVAPPARPARPERARPRDALDEFLEEDAKAKEQGNGR